MPAFTIFKGARPSSSGHAVRFETSRPTPCAFSYMPLVSLWETKVKEPALAKYHPGRKALVSVQTDLSWQSDTHYGEFIDASFGSNALSPLIATGTYKWKPESRMVDFQTRKRAGEIILKPMERYEYTTTCFAGQYKTACNLWGVRTITHKMRDVSAQWPVIGTGCSTYPQGRLVDDFLIEYIKATNDGEYYSAFDYEIWTASKLIQPMDLASLNGLSSLVVEQLRSMPVDTGLATAVKAEANAKTLDILTAFAELPQTVESVMDSVKDILSKFVKAKRKIRNFVKTTAGMATESANVWLQFRYEIMPNILLIEDALKVLNASTIEYQSTRQGNRFQVDIPPYAGWSTEPIDVLDRCFLKRRFEAEMSVARQQLSADSLVTWWELQPLSFVIDWVLNIGDLLGSLGSPQGTMQDASSYSHRFDDVVTFTNPNWVGPPITVQMNFYKINVLDLNNHLGLNISPSMTWKRWLDAVSLGWLAYKGHYLDNLRKL